VPTGRSRRGRCSGYVIMARSCTRGDNILASLGTFLGSITEMTEWLMNNILMIADVGNSLNHVQRYGA
jgi:hypothetical protein